MIPLDKYLLETSGSIAWLWTVPFFPSPKLFFQAPEMTRFPPPVILLFALSSCSISTHGIEGWGIVFFRNWPSPPPFFFSDVAEKGEYDPYPCPMHPVLSFFHFNKATHPYNLFLLSQAANHTNTIIGSISLH